jgi:hypothetical protein
MPWGPVSVEQQRREFVAVNQQMADAPESRFCSRRNRRSRAQRPPRLG